jgi:hypothetical protein
LTYIPAEERRKQEAEKAKEREKALAIVASENRIFGFCKPRNPAYPELREANPLQKALLEAWDNPAYKVFTLSGANRIGKTFSGSLLGLCTLFGEYPWNGKKINFPHKEPRKVRYVGQAWESHVKAVVEPMLKFWWPKSRPLETKKNNQGIEAIWIDKRTKSSLEIMSNVQDSSVFEGWMGDLVIYDEPPKRDVRIACARGLIDRQGRELFCMTLLKEAWIHREVMKAKTADGSPDMSVMNINGDIYSNVGYGLTTEGINQFAKTLTDDEKQSRLFGKPSYMSSLVCPKFDIHTHVKERFKIPLDALVGIQVDFHPSRPWAITFMATLKSGFKYLCEEIKFRGNPKAAAEEIVRIIKNRQYVRIHSVKIDPLAKSGEPNDIDVYSVFGDTLAAYGYSLDVASKDKDNGIAILNSLLWSENDFPALYFFKDCVETIEEIEAWMFDPETFKPSKEKDDFVETLYRHCLDDINWYPEQNYDIVNQRNVML